MGVVGTLTMNVCEVVIGLSRVQDSAAVPNTSTSRRAVSPVTGVWALTGRDSRLALPPGTPFRSAD